MKSRRSTEVRPASWASSRTAALALCLTAVAAIHLVAWAWVEGLRVHRPRSSGSVNPAALQAGDRPAVLTLAEPLRPAVEQQPPTAAAAVPAGGAARLGRVAAGSRSAKTLLRGEQFEAAPATESEPYLAPEAVDRPALARSSPDLSLLQGVPYSGLPIRVRLDISAAGLVDRVTLLESGPDDGTMVERLRQMWLATPHIPARLAGRDVASSKMIELSGGAAH